MELRVLVADTTDPYFNLATEDWIFRDMSAHSKVLFLWRNDRSIIVGRGQNVWSECDLKKVEQDEVNVVRRHSGGGAVYQDLGNTCFTFMSGREPGLTTKDLYRRNNEILISALKTLGVQAEASGRNDLIVERDGQPFKISGSAFKESKDRCFHHGTMLMDVDLTRLGTYLTPDSKKLQAKGIKSVKARVLNLVDIAPRIGHESFCSALIDAFFEKYETRVPVEHLDASSLRAIEAIKSYHDQLRSWDWIFGKTPHFELKLQDRFSWGGVELHLDTERGHFKNVKLYTDSLLVDMITEVSSYLIGQPYTVEGVQLALKRHLDHQPAEPEILRELYCWLGEQL